MCYYIGQSNVQRPCLYFYILIFYFKLLGPGKLFPTCGLRRKLGTMFRYTATLLQGGCLEILQIMVHIYHLYPVSELWTWNIWVSFTFWKCMTIDCNEEGTQKLDISDIFISGLELYCRGFWVVPESCYSTPSYQINSSSFIQIENLYSALLVSHLRLDIFMISIVYRLGHFGIFHGLQFRFGWDI